MVSPLITTTSPYLLTLQARLLFTLTTSCSSQNQKTCAKKIQKLTRPSSLALVPYSRPLSSETVCFFSKHCGYNALDLIEKVILSATSSIVLKNVVPSSKSLAQALILKALQGVPVSIHCPHKTLKALGDLSKQTNVTLYSSHASSDKQTLIVDEHQVVTGARNFTTTSLHREANLMMRISSLDLANLIEKNQKGEVCLGQQKVCYCPISKNKKGGNEKEILKKIQKATSSIQLGTSCLTSQSIILALDEAVTRSVIVTVIIDSNNKQYTLEKLSSLCTKINIRVGTRSSSNYQVCIVDHTTAIIGCSSNRPTRRQNATQEAVLIISPLTECQKQDLCTWWRSLCESSTAITYEEAENADSSSSE
jgi:Phosphatidylserine/phosphatidylglycerophosphate/cardiolipin synthases and related enzymes